MSESYPRVTTGATIGPVDATAVPRYAGPATFARLPRLDEVAEADVVLDTSACVPRLSPSPVSAEARAGD